MVVIMTLFAGMTVAMPLVSRPSFGTIFAHTTEIQNSGAHWFVHLHVEPLPNNLMPDSNRKSLSDMRLCFIPTPEINSTNQQRLKTVEMITQTCAAYRTVLLKFDLQQSKLARDIKQMIVNINEIMEGAHSLTRQRRDALLDFVSSIGKGLFGFAKQSDLAKMATFMINLVQQTNATADLIIRNQDRFESATRLQKGRISVSVTHVQENQRAINRLIDSMRGLNDNLNRQLAEIENEYDILQETVLLQNRLLANLLKGAVAQTTALQMLRNDLQAHQQALQTALRGTLPMGLVRPPKLQDISTHVRGALRDTHAQYELATEDLQHYYESMISVNRIDKVLTLSFRIPLSAGDYTNFHVYELRTVHIPVLNNKSTLATTRITNVKPYFAISRNGEYFMELDEFQLRHCSGTRQHKICNPYMVQSSTAKNSCALGLFKDLPLMVRKYCMIEYYESEFRDTEIIPLGRGRVLLSTQETNWAVHCATQSPRIISNCEFCVVYLNCSCSLRGIQDYIPPVMEHCEDNTYEAVVRSPINALTYLKFYDEIDAANFTGQSFQSQENKYILPPIEIKRVNTGNIVQQDADSAMNLDKIIANMRQNQAIYQTKADKLYAETSLITNVFQSTMARIAMAAMTIINIASVALGICTFFKVRELAILWAFNQQINPGQAYGNYFKERECVNISELVICITTLLCVLYLAKKVCKPLTRCLYHRNVMTRNMMYTTAPVM